MAGAVPDREKALDLALAQIDKQFGKGSIMRLGSRDKIDVPAIPTGSLSLDAALGVGGWITGPFPSCVSIPAVPGGKGASSAAS